MIFYTKMRSIRTSDKSTKHVILLNLFVSGFTIWESGGTMKLRTKSAGNYFTCQICTMLDFQFFLCFVSFYIDYLAVTWSALIPSHKTYIINRFYREHDKSVFKKVQKHRCLLLWNPSVFRVYISWNHYFTTLCLIPFVHLIHVHVRQLLH